MLHSSGMRETPAPGRQHGSQGLARISDLCQTDRGICNLDCHYCYYLQKELLYPQTQSFRMPEDLLEEYIVQQIAIAPEAVISFFWHGGEPTILGLDYFRKIVELQRKHQPPTGASPMASRRMGYSSMTTGAVFLPQKILLSGSASTARRHCTTRTV